MNDHTAHRLFLALLSLIPLVLPPVAARAGDSPWVITPGIGHDQFEQTFFLEDSLAVDPDSLRSLERTIEELKESYVSLETAYDRGATRISNTVYATDAAWRNVADAHTRHRAGRFSVNARGRLEWKGDDDRDSLSSAYLVTQLSATPRMELNDHWEIFTRGDWEKTDYDEGSLYGLDYTRGRARLGVRYSGDLLESIELTIGGTSRAVPDSSRLSYDESWLSAEALYWSFGPTRWSASLAFASRQYEADAEERNHDRGVFELESRWQISSVVELTALGELERWDYQSEGNVYYDFTTGQAEGMLKYRPTETWQLGIDGQLRWEHAGSDAQADDNFSAIGVGPVVSWQPNARVWIELASRWGTRRYDAASLVYDDFRFAQIDVRADASLGDHMTVMLAASYEEERHDDPTRDAEYAYGSFAVRFPFRL
jgi:hypothetical protein